MNQNETRGTVDFLESIGKVFRRFIFRILSVGPIPAHIAFIMDGNRRFAKKNNLEDGAGHKAGFSALMSILKYCYELGVRYVTVYAFSIDNFKREPEEVQILMDLLLEKIESLLEKESIVNQYGIRVYFIGDLRLLNDPVKTAAEKVMQYTAKNFKYSLLVCIAYTSTDEIAHAVEEACNAKWSDVINPFKDSFGGHVDATLGGDMSVLAVSNESKDNADREPGLANSSLFSRCRCRKCVTMPFDEVDGKNEVYEPNNKDPSGNCLLYKQEHSVIKLVDIEKHMYMSVAPYPDILVRTSGENRLSNFLLWQTSTCPLYSPKALWPEIGFWHLVCAILIFQRNFGYLERKKKQL